MGVESWAMNEEEKKKKALSEKDIKENNKKIIEHQKVKEKISVEIEAEDSLNDLKDLIDKWVITKETANKIVEWENIDETTIKEIFEKIDQLEEIKDIDNYLPIELRISRDDYSRALHDDIFRLQTITKLDSALTLIANKINPDSALGLNLFSWFLWFLTVLDKNLVLVQENTIDIKDNLKEVDEKKHGKKIDMRSLWEKIVDFLKDIFS